jgi:hypothetical protein
MNLNEQILRTMSSYHAQKSMISLIRLKQRQQSENKTHRITPMNSDDDDEDHDDGCATILVNIDTDSRKTFGDNNIVGGNRDTKKSSSSVFDDDDLYTPLSPEEADEDQLAEFFNSFEVLFFEEQGQEQEEEEEEAQAQVQTQVQVQVQVQVQTQTQTQTKANTMIEESNHTISDAKHCTSKRSRPSKQDYSTYSISYFTDSDDAVDDNIIEYIPPRKRNRLQLEYTSSTVKE